MPAFTPATFDSVC